MNASEHTRSMLGWWTDVGVGRADLAVRRPCGAMLWHRDVVLDALPLGWARAENVRRAEVYVRPARGNRWSVVFLDDVPVATAARVVRKYDALVVETSPIGGCHLWLSCDCELDEATRHHAQRWLAERVGADPASTSGEHLGRLAGFKNWKRGGVWVNVLEAPRRGLSWTPTFDKPAHQRRVNRPDDAARQLASVDTSRSGREWGWICGMLEAGHDARIAYARLLERARPRRGKDAERYARRTVKRAIERCQRTGLTT